MASPPQILNDQANHAKLSRLLVNKGTQALRAAFNLKHPPPTLATVLKTNKKTLQKLRYEKVINFPQWQLLYPPSDPPDSKNFDVTLLTVLLRNICGLASPTTGWGALPPNSDTSIAAHIARIKFYRNQVYAHANKTEMIDSEFEKLWLKISEALIGLGIQKTELDELKESPLSPKETDYFERLKNWCETEEELIKINLETNADVKVILEKFQKLEEKFSESENVSEVNKLGKCDFSWISSLNGKFLSGTRQWLFDELSTWFADEHSDVMVLTAGAGVGKSVFAAELCRIYTEQGKLAACHFCQYNKSDYRDPHMILDSLASNMCDNVPGFKDKLDDQLKRRHSRETLSDAFRVLLNDPLCALGKREPMLLVIDALDESAVGGKSEFLELISDEFPNLPKWIKILITSRPELPVKEKLQHLKPVHVTPHDTKNTADLLEFLRDSLSSICKDDAVLEWLAWKCGGSFLYAYYTQLELKETTKPLTTENISELVPKGIGGFYQKQFQRLRNQLKTINSSEVNLKRFLEVLVAAKSPLPLSLLPDCLGLPDDTEYEVREAIDEVISSILPVYNDCLTVYHKSLRDWLTSDGYKEHAFTVDCQSGNEYLWKACEKVFNQIISLSTFSNFKPCPLTRYALAYGLSHMIQSGSETGYHLSVDVKVVHARTMIHPQPFHKMVNEWREIVKNSKVNELLQELNWHIRLFERVLMWHVNSAFYLQSVANRIDCSDEKRSLARSLLEQGHHFWFEDLDATELTNHFCKSVPLRTDVTCIDVSSNEQLVAVGYKDGWVSIFRVPDFQEVHTFDTMPESNVHLSSKFSPDKSMLLYDRYDRHLGMNNQSDLPFFGGDYGALWSCSFSPSGTRLVTCDGSEKIKLWDVNSGNLLARLQAGGPVDCCSFSECGLFIVANKERENDQRVNQRDVFTVWNTLTLERVDRRNIPSTQRIFGLYSICSIQQRVDRQNGQLLMSRNGNCIDVFQLPDALLAAQLYGHFFPYLLPATRYHWHDCVLHRTNESVTFTEVDQFVTMVVQHRCCKIFLRGGLATYFIGCPCSYLKATRVGPVKVQKLYVVPYFNKLNVFGVVDQRPMSIQLSFVSEPYIISCCCFSPDGSFLATCANGAPLFVLIWDTKLCTVVQVLPFPWVRASVGCWWSESLLWIYDGDLVKIPISNGRILNPSSARRENINWKPTKLLTFSDVLIFIDQENSANVARIKDGELQYVEKLPVDKSIICAAISPCNSIIFAASLETFHVWKEDQTSQPLHWVASNTGELLDILPTKDGEGEDSQPFVGQKVFCKCCITNDGATGLLAVSCGQYNPRYIIFVDLNSEIRTLPKVIRCSGSLEHQDVFYAGNSYCIGLKALGGDLVAEKITDGEVVAEWKKSAIQFDFSSPIVALSKNDLVAVILGNGAIIQFLKIVVPE